MRLVTTRAELAEGLAATGTRAVVMTMGALHAGHLALVRQARLTAEQVVVTVFVNPLQFGPAEDLARYPRTLPADLAALGPLLGEADLVFAPSVAEVYPHGDPQVTVHVGGVGAGFEGALRPGHFDGVATVVLKLMHLTRPTVALFGAKDAQQRAVVARMVADLDVGVRVVEVPTVRDADGLALSSRNAYLSPTDRVRALAVPRSLDTARVAAGAGAGADGVVAAAREALRDLDVVDYVALVDADFRLVASDARGTVRLVVAVRVGGTRLIDNALLELGGAAPTPPAGPGVDTIGG